VHEVLEPHWAAAQGDDREMLQGLIQIAVGYQHLANGNRAGARSLLVEGSGRLQQRRLAGVDLDSFARAAAVAAERLMAGEPVAVPSFPRFSTR
jgi:predicted metal-dependent hydrolase